MASRTAAVNRHPAQVVVLAFVAATCVGTVLLMLPLASDSGDHPGLVRCLFTSTSAVTVTGLATVSVEDWSLFGELVILTLIQVGGFGIMTIGALFAMTAMRRLGVRHRMLAQAEVGTVAIGEMRSLVRGIAGLTVAIEGVVAAVLAVRFWATDAEPRIARAMYSGAFHAIAAFNNAGISLYDDNLTAFATDAVVLLAVSVAIILGGLGFPIMIELSRRVRPRRWSLHTRLTLAATAALILVGTLALLAFEWTNPATMGTMHIGDKVLTAWFHGISPRTAGFNTVPVGAMEDTSLLLTTALMFIGAGPASTSGGIKATTFALLAWVLWSEVRGDIDVNVMGRRVSPAVIRQATAVVLMAIGVIALTTMGLLLVADTTALHALFEATSAFGTVGLSAGGTGELPSSGHVMLIFLMLAGRVGPITFATALVTRDRRQLFRYPEERPILG